MNREIKFRGICVITGNWAYGYYYPSNGHHIIRDDKNNECIVFLKSVGQNTGIKDNEGKEIYEGDIIEFDPIEWGSHKGNKFEVTWDNKTGSWCLGGGGYGDMEWRKVIGNIQQNKDILNK